MKRIRRLLCLLLAACLLGGCSPLKLLPPSTGETARPGGTAAPPPAVPAGEQVLNVYYERPNQAAARALAEYAAAQNVTVNPVDSPADAGLAVLGSDPGPDTGYRDLTADPLLAAAAARAGLEGGCTALPLGKTLYAYWADRGVLQALLGQDFDPAVLQNAGWKEWETFCRTLQGWIDAPKETAVALGGNTYTLPAEKTGAAAGLETVFALPRQGFAGAAFSGTLVAADWQLTADALRGPLNGLASCFALELANGRLFDEAGAAPAAVLDPAGTASAVFCRTPLSDFTAALSVEQCQDLVPVPQKCYFTDEDLSTADYNVTGLTNYPVVTAAGRLAIPDAADEAAARAGAGFILWLYTSDTGERTLTDVLGLVTPWNTASDATELGAMLVQTLAGGVVPGVELGDAQNAALEAILDGDGAKPPLNKKAWVAAALKALGADGA